MKTLRTATGLRQSPKGTVQSTAAFAAHPPARQPIGWLYALIAALTFGLAGTLGQALYQAGWSAGASTLARMTSGALILAAPAAIALRGRWHLLHLHRWRIVGYALLACTACQLCYFLAIERLDVGVATLIEYLSPLAVTAYLVARGKAKPGLLTAVGAVVAIIGLVLVIGIADNAQIDWVGVGWALGSMIGVTGYFLLAADNKPQTDETLPPVVLAACGLGLSACFLAIAGLANVVPMKVGTGTAVLAGHETPFWVPLALLCALCAGPAYLAGIGATRKLGPKVASFASYSELLMAFVYAGFLLAEIPTRWQLLGAVILVSGILAVKIDEDRQVKTFTT